MAVARDIYSRHSQRTAKSMHRVTSGNGFVILYLSFLCEQASANLIGLRNEAALQGVPVTFSCSTDTTSKLRWSTKSIGNGGERVLTREEKILPTFGHEYSVQSRNGYLDLTIRKVNSDHAGRYICLELATSVTSSAELTVIESKPDCNTTHPESFVDILCAVSYFGKLAPEAKLEVQLGKLRDFDSDGDSRRQLSVSKNLDLNSVSVSCNVRFNESSVRRANLVPENVNSVQGTVALNLPNFAYPSQCNLTPPDFNTGRQCLSSLVLAMLPFSIIIFLGSL